MKKILLIGALALLIMVGAVAYVMWSAFHLPTNHPGQVSRTSESQTILALLGDSITHGHVGASYFELVQEQLANDDVMLVNAGVNGELAYNLSQRLDAITALQPNYVTILIGTNDALAALSPESAQRYIDQQALPVAPTHAWFAQNLNAIVEHLKKNSSAQIAVLSIPPISEHVASAPFQHAQRYAKTAAEIAARQQVTYLPLNEEFARLLSDTPSNAPPYGEDLNMMTTSAFAYYLTPSSWNDYSDSHKLRYLTDNVHLNERGAAIVAAQVQAFLCANSSNGATFSACR